MARLIHAHLTWMTRHDYPNVTHYAPDLLRDRTVQRWNRRYIARVGLGLALPALLGGVLAGSLMGALTGLLWGGVVRLFVVADHVGDQLDLPRLGDRPHERHDESGNLGWLALLSWGESYYNNHAAPNPTSFGRRRMDLDPGFWLIRSLERAGLAWDVRRPK